jgi:Xaa-Pro aminopeptidase
MAMSASVNPQITDAVTQVSPHSNLDNAPYTAIAQLYATTAHALGIAVENAAATQQQTATLAQAATNQAVMQLFSVDLQADAMAPIGEPASAVLQASDAAAVTEVIANTMAQAMASASRHGFDQAGPWSEAVREIMSAAAFSLRELQAVAQQANATMVKQAATTVVWIKMIKDPDQLEKYQKMLALIQQR